MHALQHIRPNPHILATVLGKGYRSKPLSLGVWRGPALALVWLYIALSTILPLSMLLLSSVLQYTSQSFSAGLFTFGHYVDFFTGGSTRAAFTNTVVLAIGASVLCMVVGAIISYADIKSCKRLPKLLALVCVMPVAVSGVVYGLGLQQVYLRTSLYGTVSVLLLAYVAKYLPYGIMVSRLAILQIHPDLEEWARTCGAGGPRVLTRITMPLVSTSLAAVAFFVMLLTIKDLSATLVLYSERSETLSVLTWSYVEAGAYQYAAAVAVVQTVLIVALVLAARILLKIRLETVGGNA